MNLGLVERVLDLIGEDTGGEARDELGDLVLVRGFEDVVVDEEVVAEEGELLSHVSEETSDWEGEERPSAQHREVSIGDMEKLRREWLRETSEDEPRAASWREEEERKEKGQLD